MNADTRSWIRAEIAAGQRATALPVLLGTARILAAIAQTICAAQLLAAVLSLQPVGFDTFGYAFGFAAFAVLRAIAATQAERAAFERGAAARRRLRGGIMNTLLGLGPLGLRGRHSGELATIAVDRVEAIAGLHARWLPAARLAVIGPVLVGLAVLAVDWRSALILALCGLLVPAGMALAGIGAAVATRRQFLAMTRLQVRFIDRIRGIATIVLAGQAEAEAASLAQAANELRRRTMRVLRVAFLSSTMLDLAMAAAIVVIVLRFASHFHAAAGNAAGAIFILLLIPEFFLPLRGFAQVYQDRVSAEAVAEAVTGLPPPPPEVAPVEIRSVAAHGLTLAFEHVTYGWGDGQPVLQDLSFRVSAGETLLLTGASGAGKSTIIDLILGFNALQQGRITVNGAALESLVPAARAKLIGWIGQRPMIFAGTIGENIRFAQPEAPEEAVQAAIRLAKLDEVIAALPKGLETRVGEGGFGLSGGQAQRLAIARAFLKDAPLLLMDEPTAYLDGAVERGILESIKRLAIGRTVILASHSTLAADFLKETSAKRLDLDALRHERLRGFVA